MPLGRQASEVSDPLAMGSPSLSLDPWVPNSHFEKGGTVMIHRQSGAVILGTGTRIPEGVIDQEVAAGVIQRLGLTQRWNKVLPKLYLKSGVLRRASVLLSAAGDDPHARQSFYKPPTAWKFTRRTLDRCSQKPAKLRFNEQELKHRRSRI
jgi:hypothetical protein